MYRTCNSCGKQVNIDSQFCIFCGHKFDQPINQQQSESASNLCPTCGKENLSNAQFCSYCGAAFQPNNISNKKFTKNFNFLNNSYKNLIITMVIFSFIITLGFLSINRSSSRSNLPLDQAILGHWILISQLTEEGEELMTDSKYAVELFISNKYWSNTLTLNKRTMNVRPYQITNSNETRNYLTIVFLDALGGSAIDNKYYFSKDRNKFSFKGATTFQKLTFQNVGSRQEP